MNETVSADLANLERLYGALAPLPGEAPRSWVCRMAVRYTWPPLAMARFLGWSGEFAAVDFSSNPPDPARLEWITSRDMREMVLAFQFGKGTLGLPDYRCLTEFKGVPILRYCPYCLRGDDIPYYRLEWRLASSILCRSHGTLLRETCPHCGSRIVTNVSQRLVLPEAERYRAMSACRACGKSLSYAEGREVSHSMKIRLLSFQSLLWGGLQSGLVSHPTYGVISVKKLLETFLVKVTVRRNVQYTGLNWRRVAGELADEFEAHGLVVPKKRGRIWNSTEVEA